MKFKFRSILITLLLMPATVIAQVSCAAIFVSQNLGSYGINAGSMESFYLAMFRTHQVVVGSSSKSGEMIQDIYSSPSKNFSTVVTQFKSSKLLTDLNLSLSFRKQIDENINFVIQSYSERRDWSPELRDHLRVEANLYAEQTRYIEVRNQNPETFVPEKLLGTMKIIKVTPQTKIKKLPIELDFKVEMPSNAGRKFEPANFVVDKEFNKLANSEIFTQLILHAREQLQDRRHEAGKMMYFTPADRLGVKMYSKLGFTLVPGYEAPLKEGDKDWWMLGSTAEKLANLPKHLSENRASWAPEDVAWISELVQKFVGLQGTKTEREGTLSKSVQNTGKNHIEKVGVFISEPFSYKGKNFRELGIYSMGGGDVEIFLKLPEAEYPLKDGWSQQIGNIRIFYKDGVFRILNGLARMSVMLKTDGAFKKPEYLLLKDRNYNISVEF